MNTKSHCYPKSVILQVIYFKLMFTLSYRDVEEIMKMGGVQVDHSTIQRWVYKFVRFIEVQIQKRKCRVGLSWRLDKTYIKVKGIWSYLYIEVNKSTKVEFSLTEDIVKNIDSIENKVKFINLYFTELSIENIISIVKSLSYHHSELFVKKTQTSVQS